jgi:hypothetical protein
METKARNPRSHSRSRIPSRIRPRVFVSIACFWLLSGVSSLHAQEAATATAKAVGTVKAASGKSITLTAEGGNEINIVVQDGARLLRIEPGEKDLKNAAPLQLQDLQPGDRILVRGASAPDGKSLQAVSVIAMKKADLAEKQAHEREEWQRHGAGGLVTAIDPATGAVTISTSALGANKSVTVHTSKNTILRRYAPGSVKFDDATSAPLDQIKVGDQLRARGARSAAGSELTADEVVSGSFRNIAGTITSIDPSAGTITISDLATKKPIVVRINESSQLRRLPPAMAQRIAARLKANPSDAQPTGATRGTPAEGTPIQNSPAAAGQRTEGGSRQGGTPGSGQAGVPDLQQALGRMPAATLADLQKGDAVMVVATPGASDGSVVAITLLAGVEPILQASPNGSQSILTPWTLSSGPGTDAATQ